MTHQRWANVFAKSSISEEVSSCCSNTYGIICWNTHTYYKLAGPFTRTGVTYKAREYRPVRSHRQLARPIIYSTAAMQQACWTDYSAREICRSRNRIPSEERQIIGKDSARIRIYIQIKRRYKLSLPTIDNTYLRPKIILNRTKSVSYRFLDAENNVANQISNL